MLNINDNTNQNLSINSDDTIKDNYKKFLFDLHKLIISGKDYDNIVDLFSMEITAEHQKSIFLFLQSFIDYCDSLSGEELKQFSGAFYQIFLSFSPNIFNYLPNEYKFITISQLLRNDELSDVRSNFIREFHYEFVFSSQNSLDKLLEEIEKGGEISAINALNMLGIVIKNIGGYAEDSLANNVKYICDKISERYNNPFFKYKVTALLEDINFFMLNDFPPGGRNDLTRINNVEFDGNNSGYIVKIASDYVSELSNMGYSKALSRCELQNDSLNHTYEFYSFLETINLFGLRAFTKIYSYMDKLYYNEIDQNNEYLKEICINILGEDFGKRLYDIFILSINERNKGNNIFNDFVQQAEKEYGNAMSSPEYQSMYDKLNIELNNFLQLDIYSEIKLIFNSTKVKEQVNNKILLKASSYHDILSSTDIHGSINIEEQAVFMQEMHNPEMVYMINQDLNIDITNLTLQNQVHLLRFLWEQTTDNFDKFKQALYSIEGEENKYAFLNTFLACSEDMKFGDIIVTISETDLLSIEEKNLIFNKYELLTHQIDELSDKIYAHYKKIISELDIVTNISKNDIRKNFLDYSGSFFEDIFENINFGKNIDLPNILNKFKKFDLEMVGIFNLIEGLDLSEIQSISLNKIPNISVNKYSKRQLDIEFGESSDKSMQMKEIVAKRFSFKDLEAFNNDFLRDDTSEITTLENDGKILYMVGVRRLNTESGEIKYIDWLANSPDLGGFSLKLTENFLANELHLNECVEEKIEALGEPGVLTTYLFVEKFGFIVNGLSDTPETGNYGKKGNFFRLQKKPNIDYISKGKTIDELSTLEDDGKISMLSFNINDNSEIFLAYVDKQKQNGYIMSRMIKVLDNKKQKTFTCIFEREKGEEVNPSYSIAA